MTTRDKGITLPALYLQANVKHFAFGAKGDGVTDDTAALQTALNYAAANNCELVFPLGIYRITSGLTISGTQGSSIGKSVRLTGEVSTVDGTPGGVIIKWAGSVSSANTLFIADGLAKLHVKGISFYGNSAVGAAFLVTYHGGSYSPFGWTFTDCSFENVLSGGYGFRVIGTSGCARFKFSECLFQAGPGAIGYKSENANAVSMKFLSCGFGNSLYGIHINGGAFNADACEFSLNSSADVYLQIHGPIVMTGCWGEQSNQFIKTDRRTQYSSLTLIDCVVSSYPWSYWKNLGETTAQPTNDYTQWMAVFWDREAGLTLIGCQFNDVYNGASVGAIAPLTSSLITAGNQSGLNTRPTFINHGSFSQSAANTFTTSFFVYASSVLAPLLPSRKLVAIFTAGGAVTLSPFLGSTNVWTLNANTTVTMPVTALSEPGDEVVLVFIQGGAATYTTAFVNCKIVGGSFVPTTGAGARSVIKLQYDGTFWNEISRGLNLS